MATRLAQLSSPAAWSAWVSWTCGRAGARYRAALKVASAIGDRYEQARARRGLADSYHAVSEAEVVASLAGSVSGGPSWRQAGHPFAELPQFPRDRIVARGGRWLTPLALDVVSPGLARYIRRAGQVHDGVRPALR
jgi:hypothetical protein